LSAVTTSLKSRFLKVFRKKNLYRKTSNKCRVSNKHWPVKNTAGSDGCVLLNAVSNKRRPTINAESLTDAQTFRTHTKPTHIHTKPGLEHSLHY